MFDLFNILAAPFLIAMLCFFFGRVSRNVIFIIILISVPFFLYHLWVLNAAIFAGEQINLHIATIMTGLEIAFKPDKLSILFIDFVAILWVMTALYLKGFMECHDIKSGNRFLGLVNLSIFVTFLIGASANLFTTFIAYELLTLVTYLLVINQGGVDVLREGKKYLFILLIPSLIFLLPIVIYIYSQTHTLDFIAGGYLLTNISPDWLMILFILTTIGIAKMAIMPVHGWLPAAMVAPIPVSALLHAVAVVKSGIFIYLKTIWGIFGIDYLNIASQNSLLGGVITFIAGFTIFYSGIMAIKQDDIKRMLAYSTIGQLSYMIIMASLFTKQALIAAFMHMIVHGISKINLFFSAGSIYTASNHNKISQMHGIVKHIPTTVVIFLISTCSLLGIPFFAGSFSKSLIIDASSNNYFVIAALVMGAIFSVIYLGRILIKMVFYKQISAVRISSIPYSMYFAMIIICAFILNFQYIYSNILILSIF
jgi:multicomponent Na+:H+ antiporter subunit D